MLKSVLGCAVVAALAVAAPAQNRGVQNRGAQNRTPQNNASDGKACPAGTRYVSIRHSNVKPGKWTTFAKAVADHSAWYAGHKDGTKTAIARMLTPTGALSSTEAVTVTHYSGRPKPKEDAAYAAFLAEYKASSTIKDEMRACLPG